MKKISLGGGRGQYWFWTQGLGFVCQAGTGPLELSHQHEKDLNLWLFLGCWGEKKSPNKRQHKTCKSFVFSIFTFFKLKVNKGSSRSQLSGQNHSCDGVTLLGEQCLLFIQLPVSLFWWPMGLGKTELCFLESVLSICFGCLVLVWEQTQWRK